MIYDCGKKAQDAANYVSGNFVKFVEKLDENGEIAKIAKYIPSSNEAESNGWSVEKAVVVLELLKSRNVDDIERIRSFLEHSEYGWYKKNEYLLSNSCLRSDRRCRTFVQIDNTPEMTKRAFADISGIFLHKEYGAITTYLFGYCIAALFSSRLKTDGLRIPYFLQIACERKSKAYRLIHEIVDICDINTGQLKRCALDMDCDYGYCGCDHVTVFPSRAGNDLLDNLLCHRDIPIVVDGYENEKLYNAFLREVANIPGRYNKLGIKEKFNVLPILVCPSIKSTFKNVFSIDLTGMNIDEDYIELLEQNKQRLASWTFELVMSVKEYFKQRNTIADRVHQIPEEELPLFDHVSRHIHQLRVEYLHKLQLTVADVENIGYLTYFFNRFMAVFNKALRLSNNKEFEYGGECKAHGKTKLIMEIVSEATALLAGLHNDYSPVSQKKVCITTSNTDLKTSKAIQKKGTQYAKDIVKYYQSYGVLINILPDAEYKDDRYVFSVKLLPGTSRNAINRYVDEVRRLLGVGFLFSEISESSIKLVASEKPLKENSLRKILESQTFKGSKMEIPYAVGYDIMGEMVIADVSQFPHLLIGGTSGSGKSSAIHSLLMSIVYKQPADKVKLLLLDFGASRLNMFENTPHMLLPGKTIHDVKEGEQCILMLQEEVERRIKILDSMDGRDYDKALGKWPFIVCVIDEFPVLMKELTGASSKILEDVLARARKIRIHLILATQNATQKGIEINKTNLAAGIAFKCTDWHNSNAIIGEKFATKLSGKGSMYLKCDQYGLIRLQGSFMPPKEIMDVLDETEFILNSKDRKYDEVAFELEALPKQAKNNFDFLRKYTDDQAGDTDNKTLISIIQWICDEKINKVSNKKLKDIREMGYDRANRFLTWLENMGIVSKQRPVAKLPRDVYLDKAEEFLKCLNITDADIEKDHSQTSTQGDGIAPMQENVVETKKTDSKKWGLNSDSVKANSIRNQENRRMKKKENRN